MMAGAEPLRYQLLVFDWDGTLEDSIEPMVGSIRRALQVIGLEPPDAQAIRDIIGMSMEQGLAALYPEHDPRELLQQIRQRAGRHQVSEPNRLFAGVVDVLDELVEQGYWLALATGKGRPGLQRVLNHHALAERFITTVSGDEARSKPHPEMLERILAYTGVTARDALMIGDSVLDLQMAENAGVDALGVSSGAQSVATLGSVDSAQGCVDSVLDLPQWLRQCDASQVG